MPRQCRVAPLQDSSNWPIRWNILLPLFSSGLCSVIHGCDMYRNNTNHELSSIELQLCFIVFTDILEFTLKMCVRRILFFRAVSPSLMTQGRRQNKQKASSLQTAMIILLPLASSYPPSPGIFRYPLLPFPLSLTGLLQDSWQGGFLQGNSLKQDKDGIPMPQFNPISR